ncbi:C4-dicarboxylate TRAP transporter substrate-binding protein [Albimonas pacifica]|uniref:TRAP-type C4-dicarboxylate transport system, substrate-binding protein n=1 Tax=Albimonas pacifica TaxID=1114924 RepID=A0A1I3P4I0_9RHOB|nr:C4-dicarboxylate TRAP transporter substrate-binding protein [Albimonas pacifica]SFJ16339.1 TRAP-type C4-dicarboxylate transport system, substrate-binding protein [Albimonas pacifica]
MKLAIGALMSGAAAVAAMAPAQAETYTYGSFLQPTAVTMRDGQIPFFERVKERTGGEVEFESFWGGSMGGPKELLGAIDDAVLDSGLIVDVYTKKALPHSSVISSAFILADDSLAWGAAVNEWQLLGCEGCKDDFADNGQIGLAWYSTTPYVLQCTSPVSTLEDLKGKKVRSVSRLADLMSAMGAVPVSVTVAEMYEAMQRGQVDCALGSPNYLNTYNIKDFVTSIIETPIGGYVSTLTLSVNLDAWDAMGEENRQVILDEIPQLLADIKWASFADDAAGIAETKEKGGQVVQPDQAFLDKLEEMRANEWEAVIAQAKEDGVQDAEQTVASFRAILEKWQGIVAEIDHDEAGRKTFEEALRREIFSKVQP